VTPSFIILSRQLNSIRSSKRKLVQFQMHMYIFQIYTSVKLAPHLSKNEIFI